MSEPFEDEGPHHAFEDSRRLTGPNRWSASTAVILTPLSSAAANESAHTAWAHRVRAMCSTLGWPDPHPIAHRHATGTFLTFTAPDHALLTATEVNEWAWEQAAADRAFREGFEEAHTLPSPTAAFAQRAAEERSRPLERLKSAARERGLPIIEDDDALTLGAGRCSVTHPRAALPMPMDVPWPTLHNIPTALITGSNGKTTTVRALAAMAHAARHTAGLCSTEGIVIGGEATGSGDYSGPAGARAVLRDKHVTLAVLETARGGIARRGLAITQADVAVVTNISADHFGEYGIDTVADLAELKLVVARAVTERGLLVLNADDAVLMAAADCLPHAANARRALFAANADHPALTALRQQSGATCGARDDRLVLDHAGASHDLGAIKEMPLTFNGAASYNTMNLAAAALAAIAGLALPINAVRTTLACFGFDPRDNAGRLERHTHHGATVLIDYAHNPDGLARLLAVARALPHKRLLLLLGQAGNRSEELPNMLRGRAPGEVPALLRRALIDAGLAETQLPLGGDEIASALMLLQTARPDDVLILPLHSAVGRSEIALRIGV
jgi:cyanophycin synthetase